MSGLLGGGSGGVNERIADILVEVFDKYDIEPGELNEKMSDTIELVQEFAPVIRDLQELSEDMDTDVEQLREDIGEMQDITGQFSENSEELADQLERTADAFENFNQLIAEAAEADEDN